MTGAGSDQEPQSSETRLIWDGTQFIPANEASDELPAVSQISITPPDRWLPIGAFVLGLLILGLSVPGLLFLPRDLTYDGIFTAAGAVGAGLWIWCGMELTRLRPLPERIRNQSLEDRLSHALRFDSKELALNRRGRLSIVQRLRLVGFDLGWWLTALACFGLVVGVLHLAGFFDPIKDVRALFFVGLGVYALWRASSTLIDAAGGRVRMDLTSLQRMVLPGNFITERWGTDSTAYYGYQGKDGLRFAVSRSAFDALAPGTTYRVYYTPLSKRLMSLEASTTGPADPSDPK